MRRARAAALVDHGFDRGGAGAHSRRPDHRGPLNAPNPTPPPASPPPGTARVVVHADEACLGNGREGTNPGGAGGLVEAVRPRGRTIERFDYFVCEPATTNNRMAIRSAITALELIGRRGKYPAVLFVSDSEYLIKGMRDWLRSWLRRGWKNVKNPELWQHLVDAAAPFAGRIEWKWVRGHAKHVKNEYADFLATQAAKAQQQSGGLVPSGFLDWLAARQAKGRYTNYDPDEELGG